MNLASIMYAVAMITDACDLDTCLLTWTGLTRHQMCRAAPDIGMHLPFAGHTLSCVLAHQMNGDVAAQTREALQHAQEAGCPIILALTKCDMPSADPERVKSQLLSAGLLLEEAGGNVMVSLAIPAPYLFSHECTASCVGTRDEAAEKHVAET